MSAFRDLDDILVDKPIRLPVKGKTYEFPGSIPGRTALMLQRLAAAADKAHRKDNTDASALAQEVFSDSEELDLQAEVMGDGQTAMAADGLTSAHINHVFRTLLVWHMSGEEAAAKAWESLGEAPAPNRAARRATASTTRSRASTSGTTTPPRKRAAASPGRKSSGTGR